MLEAERLRGLRTREAALEAVGLYCCGPEDVAVPLPEPLVCVPVPDTPAGPTRELCPDEPVALAPPETALEMFSPEMALDEAAPVVDI